MTIPTTFFTAIVLTVVAALCWGLWINTFRKAGKWRFEIYYLDFGIGFLLAAAVICATAGTLGSDITFLDNLIIVRWRQIGLSLVAGGLFNLGNILMLASVSVAGLAVGVTIGLGGALVVGSIWTYIANPRSSPGLLFAGCAALLLAVLLVTLAYKGFLSQLYKDQLQKAIASKLAKPARRKPWKAVLLALFGGVFMGTFYPLVDLIQHDAIEMGPYSIGILFAGAVFLTTIVYSLFFMNLPVQGEALSPGDYTKATARQHLLGLLGGILVSVGVMANLVMTSAQDAARLGPTVAYSASHAAIFLLVASGLYGWKEFRTAPDRTRMLVHSAMFIALIGVALCTAAPFYPR